MNKTHGEMQSEHYEALKNPLYQMEGMMDVLREELSNQMPYYTLEQETIITEHVFRPRKIDKELDQLKAELKHLHLEIDRLKIVKKKEAMPF